MKLPNFGYDGQTLREVVQDAEGLRSYIADLETQLQQSKDPVKQASLLGEIGTYLRSLGDLDQAEQKLKSALALIETHALGSQRQAQQMIRLAHVYQWKKDFAQSNALFEQVISLCQEDRYAKAYLDFALQHAGKNFFDQERWSEALVCFQKALELRIEKASPQDQIESTEKAIAETKRRMGGSK